MNLMTTHLEHAALFPRSVMLTEVFTGSSDAAAAGFVLAQINRSDQPLLWVQDEMAKRQTGFPSVRGFDAWRGPYGVASDIIRVDAKKAVEVLWVMEESLGCRALSAVVGEIWGASAKLDFTATKRLVLRAERSGIPAYLLRVGSEPTLSAAQERWRVTSTPSTAHSHDPNAPGDPTFLLELFRTRWRRCGVWRVRYDRKTHRLDMAPELSDRAMDTKAAPVRRSAG